MKNSRQIKKWILKNCVNENGDIILSNLDFSDFDGDIDISNMKVKKSLFQGEHKVKGILSQSYHEVDGILYQLEHKVGRSLHQSWHNVKGDLYQSYQKVDGDLRQNYHTVNGDIHQVDSEFGGAMYVGKLNDYRISETASGALRVTHKPKQMTIKELEALVGGKFEIVEE